MRRVRGNSETRFMNDADEVWTRRALELAERGRGFVEPNPLVGAVVVRDGVAIGEGWHERFGGPHAEVNTLSAAGEGARGATLYVTGTRDIADAADAAIALKPLAGPFASVLFAARLVNAALLSAAILPLATTYNICEGLGVESGINKRFSEAPIFYWLYTALIAFGAGIVLIPRVPLIKLILLSQVANGVLLPFVLFYMLKAGESR